MLATGCFLLKVLVLAGTVIALLPEDLLEDRADHVPISLQEECASKCPDLDLTQVRNLPVIKRDIDIEVDTVKLNS